MQPVQGGFVVAVDVIIAAAATRPRWSRVMERRMFIRHRTGDRKLEPISDGLGQTKVHTDEDGSVMIVILSNGSNNKLIIETLASRKPVEL